MVQAGRRGWAGAQPAGGNIWNSPPEEIARNSNEGRDNKSPAPTYHNYFVLSRFAWWCRCWVAP
jgi:hypothetical protein